MQRVGNIKEAFLSFENLYAAFKKAYKATKNYTAYGDLHLMWKKRYWHYSLN